MFLLDWYFFPTAFAIIHLLNPFITLCFFCLCFSPSPHPNFYLFSIFLTSGSPRFIKFISILVLYLLCTDFYGQQDPTWFSIMKNPTSLLSFNKQRRMNSLTQSVLCNCRPAHHCGFIPNIWSSHRPNSTYIILAAQHRILHCIKSLQYPYAITIESLLMWLHSLDKKRIRMPL